jgi:hypothetical protein
MLKIKVCVLSAPIKVDVLSKLNLLGLFCVYFHCVDISLDAMNGEKTFDEVKKRFVERQI